MKAVEKAIWFIENHYGDPVSLDDLARVAEVSRFHLSRSFVYVTGIPASAYLRDRRLSQAAHRLAAGEADILNLALSLGYGSHEAFSRAFKRRFGETPEQIRNQGHTDNLQLLEAMKVTSTTATNLTKPRLEQRPPLLLAGISRNYRGGDNAAIPGQWQEFGPLIGRIDAQLGNTTYGVVYNMDEEDNHDYLCAVEVKSFDGLPAALARLRLPEQTYAIFQHPGHVSGIQATCAAIWGEWLPNSGRVPADAPFLERYGESFDPRTGNGGLEIWLPLE
jgi:AraC family transcriptional regulator